METIYHSAAGGLFPQDGAYLAKLLLDKGCEGYGTARDAQVSAFHGLASLGIRDKVNLPFLDMDNS